MTLAYGADMDAVTRLTAIEDIRALKARYFRLLDDKKWSELAALFTDDATMDLSEVLPAGTPKEQILLTGSAAIVRQIGGLLGDAIMIHNGYGHEIDILSQTAAKAIWSMEDYVIFPEGTESPFPFRRSHAFGRYYEDFVKGRSGWRISYLRLTRQFQEHG